MESPTNKQLTVPISAPHVPSSCASGSTGRPPPRVVSLLPFLAVALLPLVYCSAPAANIDELESLVRQWLAVRREISQAAAEWREKETLLAEECQLLEDQRKLLAVKLADEKKAQQSLQDPLLKLTTGRDAQERMLETFEETLTTLESGLLSKQKRIPGLLRVPLRAAFARIASQQSESARPGHIEERLQNVLNLLAELEQLSRGVHVGRTVVPDAESTACEVDVILLGLAVGYAVSPDGSAAAVGHPRDNGWVWEWTPGLAPAVLDALACYRKERPARLVTLPMETAGGAE